MHVALLFPPAADPRAPHLAIPSLAACLKRDGVRVTVRDLNLEGLLWSLQPDVLVEAERKARARLAQPDLTSRDRTQLLDVLASAGTVMQGAGRALNTLRDSIKFYDPDEHHQARALVRSALALVSAQVPRVRYDISNAAYEVDGIDRTIMSDLVRVTADREANVFHEFWEERLFKPLACDRPDFVGVSILNGQQIIPGLTLARRLREHGHTVLIGGTVYAKFVKELLERPQFFEVFCDGIVPYEGESTFRALAAGANLRGAANSIPNLIRLDAHKRPALGPTHVEDVDALPTPDFSLLPLDDYLSPLPVLPILTGKGCYFNRCKFCDIPHINRVAPKAYRVRKPETIAADVANLHLAHGARHFVITDETLSPNLLMRLADAIEDRPDVQAAEPRFVGYARFEKGFTPEVCRRLFRMGLRKLFFGLESGSQATLDHMDKGVDVTVARDVLGHCVDAHIGVHVFSIVGFPQETESSARETLAFFVDNATLLDHPRNSFDIHPFGLDLRTAYYDDAATYGAIIDLPALNATDFPISVKSWSNRDGLSQDDVANLISEFNTTLHTTFRGSRLYPEQHWPGFEEYAVLYADHFDTRPFNFRTALPSPGDPQRFHLAWASQARRGAAGEPEFRPWIPIGALSDDEVAQAVLEPLPADPMDVDTLLGSLAKRVSLPPERRSALRAALSDLIDRLLAERRLWFRPAGLDCCAASSFGERNVAGLLKGSFRGMPATSIRPVR
ncbi:MAG: radical SAM protein [Betaproteobacteria bacterium]